MKCVLSNRYILPVAGRLVMCVRVLGLLSVLISLISKYCSYRIAYMDSQVYCTYISKTIVVSKEWVLNANWRSIIKYVSTVHNLITTTCQHQMQSSNLVFPMHRLVQKGYAMYYSKHLNWSTRRPLCSISRNPSMPVPSINSRCLNWCAMQQKGWAALACKKCLLNHSYPKGKESRVSLTFLSQQASTKGVWLTHIGLILHLDFNERTMH